ncbi:Protein of unknown function [Pricia antarctica]|uniref:DUF2452 domain-containing protein n=1 Tax=Pricia antarctica TaxID=641691 RepID=A0A1G7BUU8_9FLAO|nr:DUF2452 domain-containing protein [Pricia antarctica]SDE30901.1 Protein of unknown function [Pricia antarctica]
MAIEKKPDHIVYNADNQKYDAYLKPYATNIGAPVIKSTDSIAWKNRSVTKLNHKVQTRFKEIKEQYEQLMQEFEDNRLLYDAKFTFEPIIGQHYHLYVSENGENFLSIIAPDECSFSSLGSFYLNADQTWEKVV